MEQAINTFQKGLQMDTSPINLGTDTLTDVLNGTIVTMNGNEVILQNDMGNRKIDNAYLPTGYLPVGMKEYGGIIYVASYNPITNKSLIGSFPSPERRIGEENSDLGETFDFDIDGKSFTTEDENGIKFLTQDSLLIPLTSDTSLHAGDKFSVYCPDMWKLIKEGLTSTWGEKLITNFNNIYKEPYKADTYIYYVHSPKNKFYTFQLGILNSQNEFVDITKSLERWDKIIKGPENPNEFISKIIDEFEKDGDLYKFNRGYFIASSFNDGQSKYTGDDEKLIAERLKMAANTYSYKLVGPLYLKVTLNHIESFSYSIDGNINGNITKNDDGTTVEAEITITANIKYNCPDGITGDRSSGNDTYYTLDTGIYDIKIDEEQESKKDFNWFKVFDLYDNKNEKQTPIEVLQKNNTVYDSDSNLYSTEVLKKYKVSADINDGKALYKFKLLVPICDDTGLINNNKLPDIYIKNISEENGEIDLLKLRSGKIELSEWRFINDINNKIGKIVYKINSYPKIDKKPKDLKFRFYEWKKDWEGKAYTEESPDKEIPVANYVLNGLGEYTFNIEEIGLKELTFYRVVILCTVDTPNDTIIDNGKNTWYLTTELFNNRYSKISSDYTKDFREITNYKFNIDLDPSVYATIDYNNAGDHIISGNYFLQEGDKPENFYCYNSIPFKVTFGNNKIKSIDKSLFPKIVEISELSVESTITLVKDNRSAIEKNLLNYTSARNGNFETNDFKLNMFNNSDDYNIVVKDDRTYSRIFRIKQPYKAFVSNDKKLVNVKYTLIDNMGPIKEEINKIAKPHYVLCTRTCGEGFGVGKIENASDYPTENRLWEEMNQTISIASYEGLFNTSRYYDEIYKSFNDITGNNRDLNIFIGRAPDRWVKKNGYLFRYAIGNYLWGDDFVDSDNIIVCWIKIVTKDLNGNPIVGWTPFYMECYEGTSRDYRTLSALKSRIKNNLDTSPKDTYYIKDSLSTHTVGVYFLEHGDYVTQFEFQLKVGYTSKANFNIKVPEGLPVFTGKEVEVPKEKNLSIKIDSEKISSLYKFEDYCNSIIDKTDIDVGIIYNDTILVDNIYRGQTYISNYGWHLLPIDIEDELIGTYYVLYPPYNNYHTEGSDFNSASTFRGFYVSESYTTSDPLIKNYMLSYPNKIPPYGTLPHLYNKKFDGVTYYIGRETHHGYEPQSLDFYFPVIFTESLDGWDIPKQRQSSGGLSLSSRH